MARRQMSLSLLICMLFSAVLGWAPLPAYAAPTPPPLFDGRQTSITDLTPLPIGCIGGLPPGAGVPTCCMFGYVLIDGQAVAGARVTVTSAHGSVTLWTSSGAGSAQPYYRVSLSDAPLSVQSGETITIEASFSMHEQTVTHTALGGGQQVDLVLPRHSFQDYVHERSFQLQLKDGRVRTPEGVAVDAVGQIYVADSDEQRIQVFGRDGQFLRSWGSLGDQPGLFNSPLGLAVDAESNVYVVDSANQRVQKFSSTGAWLTSWGSYGMDDGQFAYPRGIALDSDGNVYVADTQNNRIQKFTAEGRWLATWGGYGQLGLGLNAPAGVALDRQGNVYVADTYNHRIVKLDRTGHALATWGSLGSNGGQFRYPSDLKVDSQGNLYVVDTENSRIQKLSGSGRWIESWSGSAERARLARPHGLALDQTDTLYISDTGNQRIQRWSARGSAQTDWGTPDSRSLLRNLQGVAVSAGGTFYALASDSIQRFSSAGLRSASWGGSGSGDGQLQEPTALALGRNNDLYVSDTGNNRIQRWSLDGVWLASWGGKGSENGRFTAPGPLAVDQDGNVYVADTGNGRIQKFSADGAWLASWGEIGEGNGQFNQIRGIAAAGGRVYVADSGNHRIQIFSGAGEWLASRGGLGDGDGRFGRPGALIADKDGSLYVADTGYASEVGRNFERIQKFSSSGAWVGSWGDQGSGAGQFSGISGIALDQNGLLYVAELFNRRIQRLRPLTFTAPVATIVASGERDVVQGQAVELFGRGAVSDPRVTLRGYEWAVDDAVFAYTAEATLQTAGLSSGAHMVTLRVQDGSGAWSEPRSITLDVHPAAAQPQETWTMLLYLDGDTLPGSLARYLDRNSAQGALFRLEKTVNNPHVPVVALYDGPGQGDSSLLVLREGQTETIPVGEIDMGNPQSLVEFVRWGQQTAPADHYYLAVADHADSINGIAWDTSSGPSARLSPTGLREALAVLSEGGAQPLDVLHLDACLLSTVEMAYQLRGTVRYLIVSENLAWSAFSYERYRGSIGARTSPAQLARAVVDGYAERVSEAQPGEGPLPYTIAALKLDALDRVISAADTLARQGQIFALESAANRAALAGLRDRTQFLDTDADLSLSADDDAVDLLDWAGQVSQRVSDPELRQAARALQDAFKDLVLHERHASGSYQGRAINLSRATGLAVMYPATSDSGVFHNYLHSGLSFPLETRWDEFLAAALPVRGMALASADTAPEPTFRPLAPLPLETAEAPELPYRYYVPVVQQH
jgi:DNA-binding beta-propeller fold protein YncE